MSLQWQEFAFRVIRRIRKNPEQVDKEFWNLRLFLSNLIMHENNKFVYE